ncbi:guanylin-like [Erpetoichthys calabaricus]|uniref:guanylin-like n=1 Tax=Erpetoichthys calabaricus TaxID=27687 RepID=UPI0010A0A27D|nr:guanylin-like [Erpetoichthys calabaricus]
MKVLLALFVFAFLQYSSYSVQVQDGDVSFSLESVKRLWALMDTARNPNMAPVSFQALCANVALPEEFKALCEKQEASAIFYRLGRLLEEADLCEICSNAACTGCL